MRFIFKRILVASVAILLSVTFALAQTKWLPDFYGQAGYISISDPEAVMVGSLAPGQTLKIGLKDVGLFTGHICPGAASGFMLTKMALKELFGKQIPERGKIRIATMPNNDLANVAAYITGILPMNLLGEHPDLIVDPKLKPQKPGKLVLIFQRKDTGKMVKAVFDKAKIEDAQTKKAIFAYKKRFAAGRANEEEIDEMGALIQNLVKKIILDTSRDLFKITPCSKYKFPNQ